MKDKELLISWLKIIEQMASDKKTINGIVMSEHDTLNEIKVIARDIIDYLTIDKLYKK